MNKLVLLIGATMLHSSILLAQDNTFTLTTSNLAPYFPAYLGNGYFSVVSSPLGTKPAESYAAWIFDEGSGDISRIAQLPAWNAIDFSDGTDWLNEAKLDSSTIQSFHQTLNMEDGILQTAYTWSHDGKHTKIETETFVSRANKNLAAVKLAVTPEYAGTVSVAYAIQANAKPHRMSLGTQRDVRVKLIDGWPDVWYPGYMELVHSSVGHEGMSVEARPEGRMVSVAEAVEWEWTKNARPAAMDTSHGSDGGPVIRVSFKTTPGVTYEFYKFIAVTTSRDDKDPVLAAKKMVYTAHSQGYAKLRREHAEAWHGIWKTDIIVDGDAAYQRLIHSMMFYLLCSIREKTEFGIPPMGLSSCGYYGHIFWDSDTWMLPPLLVMHPEFARSMVDFRYRTLKQAEENAVTNKHGGAMYPWEADDIGKEAIPVFAIQNGLYENHVTGDVALAQWQYYLMTGDKTWLAQFGYPVIRRTADFWVSRSVYNKERDLYEIKNVVSVDEGLIGITNDAYTNAVAQKNLAIAIEAGKLLTVAIDPQWDLVRGKLLIPFDSVRQLHPTYAGAPDSILGSVVPLLAYPLGVPMSEASKKNDILNGARMAEAAGPGVMMGVTLLPVAAAETGDQPLFDRLIGLSYKTYLRPPFQVLAETPQNNSTNFLTGAGGFLQQVIFGYTGLRIGENGLTQVYKPMLPHGITRLVLKNFYNRGKRSDITVQNGDVRIQPAK
jgi:protein-glucosylgalactosylhydroxylysine glucosidase